MKNVYLISYPRSGQHYTQRLLEKVTGAQDYCQFYYCAKDSCPGKTLGRKLRSPCPSGKRFQKNHDFALDFPVSPDSLYAVLFRKPLFSLASYYELQVRKTGLVVIAEPGKTISLPDNQETWERFAFQSAEFWRGFILKWIPLSHSNNVMAMRYEDITRDISRADDLFRFIFPNFDQSRLNAVMEEQRLAMETGSGPDRRLSDFRYRIDDSFISQIRSVIGEQALELAGYNDIL